MSIDWLLLTVILYMYNYVIGVITMQKENKKQINAYKKIPRTFSFAYEDGYKALEYLDKVGKTVVGGKSGYIINLILQDMQRQQNKTGE